MVRVTVDTSQLRIIFFILEVNSTIIRDRVFAIP